MSQAVPVVYLLHGDDEFAISQFVKEMESKLGDPSIAEMNITRLDGKTLHPDEIITTAGAMPFLARRRLVILQQPLINITSEGEQRKFTRILEQIPETTGLIVVENISDRGRNKKIQWFLDWAKKDPDRTLVKEFNLPKGNQMIGWIQNKVRTLGGAFTPQGAAALASLVGNDTRLATQEIEKLLAYVNYKRAVDADDVDMNTADYAQADIFALVDSVSLQQPRQAMTLLLKLLDQQEPIMTFVMIQRQFRLLLQAREIIDQGGNAREIMKQLKIHPFVSEKLNNQARRFDIQQLEAVYRRLLDLDEGIKTGQLDADLALQTFVAAFTSQ